MRIPPFGTRWALGVGLFVLAVILAGKGQAADELGNIAEPVPPSVFEPQITGPSTPQVVVPDTVLVPVSPVQPKEPEGVVVPEFKAAFPASNGTLPLGNGTFPVYNATLPASNGTLPGQGLTPVHNATRPAHNATRAAHNATEPGRMPTGPLTPADFLPKTKEKPETAQAQLPKPAEKKPVLPKPAPKPEPDTKPAPKKTAKGDPMQIPEEAKKTGNLDFLKGCWVGRRPEYHSKRMITERFCFDEKGVGKRTITDPGVAGQCVGAARAVMDQGGVLRIVSERGHCTSGVEWGQADMICRGEGARTPCSWEFKDVSNTASQAYTIMFVRD